MTRLAIRLVALFLCASLTVDPALALGYADPPAAPPLTQRSSVSLCSQQAIVGALVGGFESWRGFQPKVRQAQIRQAVAKSVKKATPRPRQPRLPLIRPALLWIVGIALAGGMIMHFGAHILWALPFLAILMMQPPAGIPKLETFTLGERILSKMRGKPYEEEVFRLRLANLIFQTEPSLHRWITRSMMLRPEIVIAFDGLPTPRTIELQPDTNVELLYKEGLREENAFLFLLDRWGGEHQGQILSQTVTQLARDFRLRPVDVREVLEDYQITPLAETSQELTPDKPARAKVKSDGHLPPHVIKRLHYFGLHTPEQMMRLSEDDYDKRFDLKPAFGKTMAEYAASRGLALAERSVFESYEVGGIRLYLMDLNTLLNENISTLTQLEEWLTKPQTELEVILSKHLKLMGRTGTPILMLRRLQRTLKNSRTPPNKPERLTLLGLALLAGLAGGLAYFYGTPTLWALSLPAIAMVTQAPSGKKYEGPSTSWHDIGRILFHQRPGSKNFTWFSGIGPLFLAYWNPIKSKSRGLALMLSAA